MAIHFIDAVKALDLPPSHKLVMVAFADSADKDTRVAWPGIESVRQWSGLKKSRALEVVADLCAQGFLRRIRGSSPGRRAEFLVLPLHSCTQCKPLANGSDVADPSGPANRSALADPNGSDVAANGSDLTSSQVRRAGPLPLVPPSLPPLGTPEDEDGFARVCQARRAGGQPLGPAWTIDKATSVVEAALVEVRGATRTEAWHALAVVASESGTEAPKLLLHRLTGLQAKVRTREGNARRSAERERERAAAIAARANAVPASAVPAMREVRERLAKSRHKTPACAPHVPTPSETAGQSHGSG